MAEIGRPQHFGGSFQVILRQAPQLEIAAPLQRDARRATPVDPVKEILSMTTVAQVSTNKVLVLRGAFSPAADVQAAGVLREKLYVGV